MKNWPKVLLVFVQLGMVLFGVNSVNAQSISNLRVSGNPLGFCPGQSYTFLFDTLGPIGPSTFQIQVSNSSGSFSSPIASASGSSTSINLLIPNSASSGANYAFRVIRTSPSLLVSDTLKNKLISKPTPSFSFSPNAACPDNDVSFTNSSTGNGSLNYAWNFARTYTYGAPVASSIASPVVRFNPFYGGATVSYEVQLVVTDAYGCKDSTSQNVGVKQRPLAQLADSNIFSSPPFSNCQGSPSASNPQFRLTVDNQCQVQNTIASISINWGEGTPVSFPGTFLQTSYTYTTLGAYNLELTATNNNGCITTQSYAVSNQINPTLTLSGPANKQGCAPFVYPIVMNNHHSNSGGTYYVFDFDDGSPLLRIDTLGSDTIWHTFINNSCSKPGGAYIVKAKAYNLCDSTPASLGNFRIYAKPRAGFSLGSDTIICANSSIAPINTTQSAQYGLSCATTTNYQWTFTGGVPATSTASTPPSISYALPGNYPIRLIASNPCGNDTFIKTVCVQAAPTANFSFSQLPSSKCSESVLNLNNISSTLTQCLPGQFLWEVRDSASNTLINPGLKFIYLAGNADTLEPTLKFLKAGKYRLRLKVTNACGVHTKDSILTVKDIPKVVLPAPQTYCDTTQIEFNGLQSNHVANYDSSFGSLTAFAWTISPSSFAFVSGNASSKSPKIKLYGNGVSSQDYQIIHTAQNECGFSLADTQLVSINAQSHTIASATDTMICSGASTSISLSSSLPSGVTYTWRAFASSPNLSGYSNQTTGVSGPINQVLNLVGNSVEYVTYRIVAKHAATNCIGDSVDIRIYLQTPIGNNSISGSAAYCIGGVSPTQIGQVPIGGNGFYSFQWQKWNGSSWVNTGVSDTLKDYTPPYLVQTEFYRRQVTSGWCNGSLGSFSNIDTLLIYQKPIVNAGLDFYKCKNETNFKLQGIPAGGNWFGTHVYAGDSFNLTAASAGIYSLIYSYTNANSCSNSDTVNLRIFSFPTVNAGSDFSICEGPDSLLLTGFTPAGGTWLGLGITTTNYFKPAVTGAGLFNLVYQYNDTNGCVGRDTIQVRVFAKPNPNFALQTQYCPNDTQTLFSVHNFSSTIISYTWQVSNLGGFSNTILSSFSISNPLVTLPENQGNSDINYSLKLLVISADGCKDSITKNTFLRRRPDAQFSANGLGNCGPLTIGLSNATNNVSSRWQWTVLPNSGVLVQTDTSQNPSVFLPENLSSASINYQLKLIAFRNDLTLSCSDTNTQFNSLYPRPNADFSINPLDSGCGPFSASFINLSDPKNAESIASMSFNWDFGAKGNDTTKNASRVYTNTGIVDSVYEVKLIATSAWGCKDTVDKQVIVKPNAKASFSTGITVSCAPFSINSSAVIAQDFPAANGIYSWYANGVLLGTGITFPGYLLANPSDSVEIKLKVLSKNGCLADSVSQKYFTIENPRPNFYAVDSIACSGSSIDLINTSIPLSGLNYRWELGSSNTISTALNPQINVRNFATLDTVFVVKLVGIAGGSGCLDSISKSILIKPLPKVNFTLSDTFACYPKTVLASNTSGVIPSINNLSFKWSLLETGASLSNDTSSIQTQVSFVDNQSGFSNFYTLKLKVASDFGCWDSLTKSLRIPTRPIANFTFVSDSFCGGINFNASNTSEYSSTYLWGSPHAAVSFNNVNLFEPNLSFASHYGLQDSIYSVQLIASTADDCYDTNEVSVKVFPLPTSSFYTNLDSGCARFDAVLKINAIVKTPATFLWNLGDGNQVTSVQDSVVHGFLGAQNRDTSYSIQLITVSENGCKDTLVQTNFIKVLGEPKSVFTTNVDTSCSPIGLYVLNQSYGSPQNYLWDFGNGETSNLAEPINLPIVYSAYDSITTFVVKLAVSNLCGADTSEKNLTVLPDLVQAKFNASAKLGCESLRVVFTDNSTAGENIAWDFGDGFTSTTRNPIHTYTAPGTYLAKQYVSNNCNFDTTSILITVYPKPNFSLNPIANPICERNAIQFGVQLVDTGSIVWHFGDGDSSTSYSPNHKYLGSGKFVYEAIVTSNYSNCSNTIIDSLFVLPLPSVSILVDTNRGCLGQAFQYSLNSNGNHYYSWDFGDSSYTVGETVAPHVYSSSGTHLVKLVGTSVEGCQDSSVLPITVWPNPIAQFDYTPKDTCAGPSWVRFTNLSIGANAYHWDFGNGNTSTALNGFEYYQGLAKYPIQLIATNTFYCSDTLVQTFEILNKPIAFFSFLDSSGCLPYQVDFTNSSVGGSKYVWYFGDGNQSTDENPSHVYTTPGIYHVTLFLQPGNVCNDSFTHPRPIKIDEKVGLTFTHELIEDKKPYREVIFKTSAFNNYNYVWEFGDGTKGFGESTFHRYAEKDSGCFNVVMFVNTSNNCDTSFIDSICLPSYWEGLYVPNAFTPDYGSEEVRVFKPAGVELISYHIKIYNKWGELVWESNGLQNGSPAEGWNGVDLNGVPCMAGTYIWDIEAAFSSGKTWDGMEQKKDNFYRRGSLNLIR